MNDDDAGELRICPQCGIHFVTDFLVCPECDRTNALGLAACSTCTATAEFDSDGRVVITHELGCRDFAEFRRQVEEIERGSDNPQ
jgi:hypothetical protein